MTAMQSCERVRARMDRYLDGELPPLEAALDRGHMEVCGSCGAEEARWDTLIADVRTAQVPDARELEVALLGVAPRLAAARGGGRRLRMFRARVLWPLATAAAAVFLLLMLELTGVDLQGLDQARGLMELPDWDLSLPLGLEFSGGVAR